VGYGSQGTAGKGKNNNNTAAGSSSRYRTSERAASLGPAVDWRDVDRDVIARAIADVVAAGDAITFSRTRDGGAYSVTVLSDGLRHFHREHLAEDIEARLSEIAEDAAAWVKATT
jgi:hypothetical protein